jgi:heme/copper-type cytochrome/quinol oxidase subunit 2
MERIVNALPAKTTHNLILLLLFAFFIVMIIEYRKDQPFYYKNKDCSEEVELNIKKEAIVLTNIIFIIILGSISFVGSYNDLYSEKDSNYKMYMVLLLIYLIQFIINMIYTLSYNNYRQIKNGKCKHVFTADKIVICVLLFCLYFYNLTSSYIILLLNKQKE